MKRLAIALVSSVVALTVTVRTGQGAEEHDYPLAPMPFDKVKLEDDFWLPQLVTQKKVTVPHAFGSTERAVENLRRCGNFLHGRGGPLPFPHRFVSSDLYKVMEGAAYLLSIERDPQLEKKMDEIIEIIADAQKEDGYLYVSHICGIARPREMGTTPYSWVVHSHELYNMGHMYEGAVAYYRATGNIVDTKMHITGGLGAVHGIEGFGPEYVLPNKEAYNETCAAVANVFFNFRMFLLHKDAKYFDVAEIALLNNSLAGVSIGGDKFFYVNPLEADGRKKFNHGSAGRSPWFDCACCPSNIARLIPQVSGYMYAHTDDEIYVTLYGGNSTEIPLNDGKVAIKQVTKYPFDGKILLTISPAEEQQFSLKLRIPAWAREKFVPGRLYRFARGLPESWTVKVNGRAVEAALEKGFAAVQRRWKPGDVVQLDVPMPVRFNTCIDKVKFNVGRVAVTRGPLVYCAEEVDNHGPVQRFSVAKLPEAGQLETSVVREGVLGGVVMVSFPAKDNRAGQGNATTVNLVPYYAWNNRGEKSMLVWLPHDAKSRRIVAVSLRETRPHLAERDDYYGKPASH